MPNEPSTLSDRIRWYIQELRRVVLPPPTPRCYLCGYPIWSWQKTHRDHIIPKSRGGSNDPSNIAVVHARCNLRKGARTPEEYWQSPGYLWENDRQQYRDIYGEFPLDEDA